MKRTHAALLAVALVAAAPWLAHAVPIGSGNAELDYLMTAKILNKWGAGAGWRGVERDVDFDGASTVLDQSMTSAFVGYNLRRWVTVYGLLGAAGFDLDLPAWRDDDDGGTRMSFGGGVRANLLDHDIPDPLLTEEKIRITAGCQYTQSTFKPDGSSEQIGEFFASLIFSLVNEIDGNKLFLPNAIAIFAGPVYSNLICDPVDEDDAFGYTAGLEIYLSERVTLHGGVEAYGSADPGVTAGLYVRF